MNGPAVCSMVLSGYSPDEIERKHGAYARYLADTDRVVLKVWGDTAWLNSYCSRYLWWCG